MSDTYKVYTSQPVRREITPYYDYEPPHASAFFWLLLMLGGIAIVWWLFYRVMNWWDDLTLGVSRSNSSNKLYYNYGNTGQGVDNTTTIIDKPKRKTWVNSVYKPQPVVPPRMFFAGRIDGKQVEFEGPGEAKYLNWNLRNRYFTQKGVSIAEQDKIEAKWKNDAYNGE